VLLQCVFSFYCFHFSGWQRYDHFAVLAELLPVAIPSLAINLLATTQGFFNESLKAELYKRLDCADGSHLYETFIDLVKILNSFLCSDVVRFWEMEGTVVLHQL
jgi:hypothetical protein